MISRLNFIESSQCAWDVLTHTYIVGMTVLVPEGTPDSRLVISGNKIEGECILNILLAFLAPLSLS